MVLNKRKILVLFVIIFSSLFLFPYITHAIKTLNDASSALNTVSKETGIDAKEIPDIVGNALQTALYIAGLLFFIFMVYAGLVWMTAKGNEERTTKAKNTMIASTIGIIILVASYGITTFIQQRLILGQSGQSGLLATPNAAGNQALGCCLDWVAGTPGPTLEKCLGAGGCLDQYIPAARWTTYDDCKEYGENKVASESMNDYLYGPEGEGSWVWYSSESGSTWAKCEEEKSSYGVSGSNYSKLP